MQKGFLAIIISLMIAIPALAHDHDTAAVSQLSIAADHGFWGEKVEGLSGYVSGSFFYNLNNDYAALFGYLGPIIEVGDFSLYPMAVIYADADAWMFGPSLWLEYSGDKNYFFIEGDYYVPVLSAEHGEDAWLPPHQYYGFAEYSRAFKDKVSFGLDLEAMGDFEDKPYEMAAGPFVQFNKVKIWFFYDEAPIEEDLHYVGVRFKLILGF